MLRGYGTGTYVMLVVENENRLPKIVSIIEMSLIDSFHIRSLVVAVTGNKWNLSEVRT